MRDSTEVRLAIDGTLAKGDVVGTRMRWLCVRIGEKEWRFFEGGMAGSKRPTRGCQLLGGAWGSIMGGVGSGD